MIGHELHRIKAASVIGPHALRLTFEDGVVRDVDLSDVTVGEMFGPLRDPEYFKQVRLNPEVETVEWPNGADFDPETLYNWDLYVDDWRMAAERWKAEHRVN